MSIYDDYRLSRTLKGQTRKDRNEYGDIRFLKKTLVESPNSADVFINKEKYRMLVLSRREDIDSLDLKFVAERETPLDEGTLLTYKNEEWLILHNQDTEYNVSKKGIGRKVTNKVKVFVDGSQVEIPICMMMTYGSNDPIDRKIVNAVIHDNTVKSNVVIMQKNTQTEKIAPYSRFLIGNRAFEINFINSNFRGLVICTASIVDVNSKTDSVILQESTPLKENLIIENKESNIVSYILSGPQQLLIGEEVIYTSNFDCTFTFSSPALVNIIETTSKSIKIIPLSKGKITLNAFKDSELKVSQNIKINGLI